MIPQEAVDRMIEEAFVKITAVIINIMHDHAIYDDKHVYPLKKKVEALEFELKTFELQEVALLDSQVEIERWKQFSRGLEQARADMMIKRRRDQIKLRKERDAWKEALANE